MLYTAQVRLEGSDVARMSDIKSWLDRHDVEPGASIVRMDADGVLFRVDFTTASEADEFADAFEGTIVVRA